jgi:hypothetical protein
MCEYPRTVKGVSSAEGREFEGTLATSDERVIGGQGWIRTSVRKTGQIYSLLPLTTRPPVHIFGGASCVGMRAGPAEEAAQWRKGPCLSMPQVGKEARTSSF